MVSRGLRAWVSLAIFLGCKNLAVNARETSTHEQYPPHAINYYYARQLMPTTLTTSSSYDYWWPYPPAAAPTTSLANTPFTPVDTLLPSTTDSALAIAFPFESSAAGSFSGSDNDISSASLSTGLSSSVSQSASIISISALPPSNSSLPVKSHAKIALHSISNLAYIVPVCAVVGILVGSITAWCVYGCLTRNGHGRKYRAGRKSYGTLEVGPEYTPPTPRPEEKQHEEEEGVWLGDEKHLGEETNDDDDDETLHPNPSDRNDGWRQDAVDDHDNDDAEPRGTETEGFLHPGSTSVSRPSRSSTRYTTRTKSSKSSVTARAKSRASSPTPSGRTSLYFERADSTRDSIPWESLRHKSIKRGILERLRYDDDMRTSEPQVERRSWQAHGRHDSDLLVSDAALSRASSSVTTMTNATREEYGAGFRMLSESPASMVSPRKERGAEAFAWPSVEVDKYTRVPARVARSRSRSPEKPQASPCRAARRAEMVDEEDPDGPQGEQGREVRDYLARSPPRISSPVLDGALCFTPIPSVYETTPTLPSFASFGAPPKE